MTGYVYVRDMGVGGGDRGWEKFISMYTYFLVFCFPVLESFNTGDNIDALLVV